MKINKVTINGEEKKGGYIFAGNVLNIISGDLVVTIDFENMDPAVAE